MLDDLSLWRFTEQNNCWEFVRQKMMMLGVPESDVPKYGNLITNAVAKTELANEITPLFVEVYEPVEFSIACMYRNGLLNHVGYCENGKIRHVSKKGVIFSSPKDFKNIRYFIHRRFYADQNNR